MTSNDTTLPSSSPLTTTQKHNLSPLHLDKTKTCTLLLFDFSRVCCLSRSASRFQTKAFHSPKRNAPKSLLTHSLTRAYCSSPPPPPPKYKHCSAQFPPNLFLWLFSLCLCFSRFVVCFDSSFHHSAATLVILLYKWLNLKHRPPPPAQRRVTPPSGNTLTLPGRQ